MPDTPVFGLPFESPLDQPGISLTGGSSGLEDILAEIVEQALNQINAVIARVPIERVVYTANDAFDPAIYSNVRMARIRVQASGGAGGGAAGTGASQASAGGGGEGGAYAESLLPWSDVVAEAGGGTIPVTVPAGGLGISGGNGNGGSTASFGSLVSAEGGDGGSATAAATNTASLSGAAKPAFAMTGQIQIEGGGGGACLRNGDTPQGSFGGMGGSAALGNGGRGAGQNVGGSGGNGFGSGGGGAANDNNATVKAGGNGAPAIVIVDLYR